MRHHRWTASHGFANGYAEMNAAPGSLSIDAQAMGENPTTKVSAFFNSGADDYLHQKPCDLESCLPVAEGPAAPQQRATLSTKPNEIRQNLVLSPWCVEAPLRPSGSTKRCGLTRLECQSVALPASPHGHAVPPPRQDPSEVWGLRSLDDDVETMAGHIRICAPSWNPIPANPASSKRCMELGSCLELPADV